MLVNVNKEEEANIGSGSMTQKIFVFPGQGSQYPTMAKDWYDNFKAAREAFEEASDFTGINLKKLCFEGSGEDLKRTEITQPAILTSTVAIYRSLEIDKNAVFAGHSLGEYSALVCAGALALGPAAKIVNKRGAFMQEAVPAGKGAMAALIFRPKTEGSEKADLLCREISALGRGYVSVANYNTPEQIVISGETEAVNLAVARALEAPYEARKAVPLAVSAPFHCKLMKPAAERLAPHLRSAPWTSARAKYYANVDAKLYDLSTLSLDVADRLILQIDGPVLWTQTMRAALEAGYHRLVEIGPGAVLSGMAKRISSGEHSFHALNIDRLEDFQNVQQDLAN
jgi:[acyl-carrier-protein] S-malonyltransferase